MPERVFGEMSPVPEPLEMSEVQTISKCKYCDKRIAWMVQHVRKSELFDSPQKKHPIDVLPNMDGDIVIYRLWNHPGDHYYARLKGHGLVQQRRTMPLTLHTSHMATCTKRPRSNYELRPVKRW